MHEPGDRIIVGDTGLAVAPGLHTLFDIAYTVVSMNIPVLCTFMSFTNLSKLRNAVIGLLFTVVR